MAKYIKELYYITHIDNVPSIVKHGILCHQIIEEKNIEFTAIYNKEIVSRRAQREVPGGKSLWDFANLYFQARNPMLYKVIHDKPLDKIVVLGVRRDAMNLKGAFIADGNAANSPTSIIPRSKVPKECWAEIMTNTQKEWWNQEDGSKRKIMAECLVPQRIAPEYIQTIYTPNLKVKEKLERISGLDIPVVPEANMFFQPTRKIQLIDNLYLIRGDMFFSKLQTLTVSVNCVGVMGKGLASRAKYQFPRVYVYYQDLCRERKLRLGRPYVYKQELSLDYELADEPTSLENGVTETWFLLFPTKDNWRNRADIGGIGKGLQWICDNYEAEGIKSLAIPALGCGLGWLDWSTVGPLLCSYLARLSIQTWVYLPVEKEIPEDQLDAKFLLSRKNLWD
ncbi:MAG: DarT ssDNA thymidine ADP-ribosyltransferase family protein [Phycisphaerae bacterium]